MKYEFEVDHKGQISDGYHTFDELYFHRMVLFSVICMTYRDKAWKSWKHHDGTMYDDYFIVGIDTPKGQYTYHYHKDYWDIFIVRELSYAPEFDGHKPEDIKRLFSLIKTEKRQTVEELKKEYNDAVDVFINSLFETMLNKKS